MRYSALYFVAVGLSFVAQAVVSVPFIKRDAPKINDVTILQYALTLEHLESTFYSEALEKFDEKSFEDAGFPEWVRGRFVEIAAHEKAHVHFLSGALGSVATERCVYKFPYTDVKSFVQFSQILEGVGASAYTGAAQFIKNPDYITAAASILATEARHASFVAAAVNKVPGWGSAFEVPLTLNEVYTIAAGVIVSCPVSNPNLPVKAYPALTLQSATPGKAADVRHSKTAGKAATYIAFLTGLSTTFVPIKEGKVVVPLALEGQVYALATNDGTKVTDDTIVAGPAILFFQ